MMENNGHLIRVTVCGEYHADQIFLSLGSVYWDRSSRSECCTFPLLRFRKGSKYQISNFLSTFLAVN